MVINGTNSVVRKVLEELQVKIRNFYVSGVAIFQDPVLRFTHSANGQPLNFWGLRI